jgi:hypothetical protein
MTLIDIVRSLPLARDELMRATGHRAQHGAFHPVASSIGLVGLGIAFGAGMALLYAPEAGHKLRRRLANRFDEVVHAHSREETAAPRETAH